MPDTMWDESQSTIEIWAGSHRGRLLECADYCRRLALQSDRPEAARSLATLASDFAARAAVISGQRDEVDRRVAAEWHI